MAKCQANVVKTIEQAVLAKCLHLKRQFFAVGLDDHLAFQVNRQHVTRKGEGLVKQLIDLVFAQYDRQQSIFEAVVEKDVGIARGNDGAKAKLVECPRRVFA